MIFLSNSIFHWILIESVRHVSSSYVPYSLECRRSWKELSKLFPTAISANLFPWKVSKLARKLNHDANPLDYKQSWCQHVEPPFPAKHSHLPIAALTVYTTSFFVLLFTWNKLGATSIIFVWISKVYLKRKAQDLFIYPFKDSHESKDIL